MNLNFLDYYMHSACSVVSCCGYTLLSTVADDCCRLKCPAIHSGGLCYLSLECLKTGRWCYMSICCIAVEGDVEQYNLVREDRCWVKICYVVGKRW